MTIIEPDFKIEHNLDYFSISFLKSKKELKDDPKIPYKPATYYNHIENAIKSAMLWRTHKKYSLHESPDSLKKPLKEIKNILDLIDDYSNKMYIHLNKLQEVFCKDISVPVKKVKKERAKKKVKEPVNNDDIIMVKYDEYMVYK